MLAGPMGIQRGALDEVPQEEHHDEQEDANAHERQGEAEQAVVVNAGEGREHNQAQRDPHELQDELVSAHLRAGRTVDHHRTDERQEQHDPQQHPVDASGKIAWQERRPFNGGLDYSTAAPGAGH